MTILVTGATGKVGSEAVRLLREQGAPVRALVRDEGRGEALAQLGAELAVGNFDDPTSLPAAVDGIVTVVLISPGDASAQELAVVAAAARAGVGHVVKLTSKASPDSPIARVRAHAQVEQGLAETGLAHTLLRSNAYMQNTFFLAKEIAESSSFSSSAGAGRIGMVDARDVAAVAAAAASHPTAHAGRTYFLTGPELITYAQIAAVLSRQLGRTVSFRTSTREEDEAALVRMGLPQPVAAMNALALSLWADGDLEWLSDDIPALLGRPARSYQQFAADNAAAFS